MRQPWIVPVKWITRKEAMELYPPYVKTSDTSKAAAKELSPKKSAMDRQAILGALRACPLGLTDWELHEITGIEESSCRPRRIDLVRAKLVYDSGRRGITPSGRKAVIWVALKGDK